MMITRKEKLVSAAMLIALFVLARPAGAAVIPTTYDLYTIFAEGTVTIGVADGTGSTIWGMVGAIGNVTIEDNTTITDRYGLSGNVFSGEDVRIWDGVSVSGRVMAVDTDQDGGGVVVGGTSASTISGRIDTLGQLNIGASSVVGGSIYQSGPQRAVTVATGVTVGGDFHVNNTIPGNPGKPTWSIATGVTVTGAGVYQGDWSVKDKGTWGTDPVSGSATAPDTFSYTTRTAPTFTPSGGGTLDIVTSTTVAPGTWTELIVRQDQTLTVQDGTYYFDNITLESGANIHVQSGSTAVIMQAMQDLVTSGANVLGRVGQQSLTFNIGNLVTIGSGSTVAAHLLAYSDTVASIVTIGNNSTILGKVYSAGNVIIGDNVIVPEPGTLALLGLGAAGLLAKRRRRKRA